MKLFFIILGLIPALAYLLLTSGSLLLTLLAAAFVGGCIKGFITPLAD